MSSHLPAKVSAEVGSGVTELYQRYVCDYCQQDVKGLRIKCADCADFDLCLQCFACGAQIGRHRNTHRYIFMNNGGFPIFDNHRANVKPSTSNGRSGRRRSSVYDPSNWSEVPANLQGGDSANAATNSKQKPWNAREELRLLDAVEMFGYGNWKDISHHIESKTPEQANDEYLKHFIHGSVGKHTWNEELRGYAVDHTQQCEDIGPLSPTLTNRLPPIQCSTQEALLLGYMPHRDDFEDFDKNTEQVVAQIADKSVEDEQLDVALKLTQCDIYERRLREQVRRKRVARDYQLVAKFYQENPIVEIGGPKMSQFRTIRKKVKESDSNKQEVTEAMRPLCQFLTAREFTTLINNLCLAKELRVRIRELIKYRTNGLKRLDSLTEFESDRFKREMRLKIKRKRQKQTNGQGSLQQQGSGSNGRFLPAFGDYCMKALLDIDYEEKTKNRKLVGSIAKKKKRQLWSRKKEKTGRRLLIQQGCILTLANSPSSSRRESTDSNSNL